MEIIKFRAWSKQLNDFLDITGFESIKGDVHGIFHDGDYISFDKEDVVIMQYTGLKDDKGVEIYEGDIVEFARVRYQVEFLDGSFVLYDRNQWHIPFYTVHGGIEVIGNTYENSELI